MIRIASSLALSLVVASPALAGDDPAIQEIRKFIEENKAKINPDAPGWKNRLPKPPQVEFDAGHDYFWHLNVGYTVDSEPVEETIKIRLMPDVAPMHVSSTIYLTQVGFYDDLIFHRVIPGFMAQGGCPNGNGRGGPGYKYAGEFDPEVKHDRPGLLSMANAGPNTDGSQFFLTFVPTKHLNGKHSIFGEVVDGMSVLKELEKRGSPGMGRPTEKLSMKSAKITVAPKPQEDESSDEDDG